MKVYYYRAYVRIYGKITPEQWENQVVPWIGGFDNEEIVTVPGEQSKEEDCHKMFGIRIKGHEYPTAEFCCDINGRLDGTSYGKKLPDGIRVEIMLIEKKLR